VFVLTKPQRDALFRVFCRDFPSWLPFRQNAKNRVTWSWTPFPIQAVWRPLPFGLDQPTGA